MEVLISSDSSPDSNTSLTLWNPGTGTKLLSLKGPPSVPGSLVLLKDEGLIIAEGTGKPFLHFWQVGSPLQASRRIICPLGGGQGGGGGGGQRLGPLAATPDGNFLVVAIQEKINIWQMATGRVVEVISSAHYRPVTVLKFTDDGAFLISGGGDGIVSLWNFLQLVSGASSSPAHSFSDHTLPVTGIHVGVGGNGRKSNLFTASEDRFVKIYSLLRGGALVLSIAFPQPLSSIVVDPLESIIFVGGGDGAIHTFNLATPPRSLEAQVTLEGEGKGWTLRKHEGRVTTLAISSDGKNLASGDAQGVVLIWDLESGQAIRSIGGGGAKGAVTNLAFWLNDPELLKGGRGKKPSIFFPEVGKLIEAVEWGEDSECEMTRVLNRMGQEDEEEDVVLSGSGGSGGGGSGSMAEINQLKAELSQSRDINRELHLFCTKTLFDNIGARHAVALGRGGAGGGGDGDVVEVEQPQKKKKKKQMESSD